VQRRSQKFTIDEKQLERARGSHFTYEMEVKLDHLVDRIGVGVFDETSKEWGLITVPVPPRKKDVQSAAERARNNGRPAPGTFTEPRPRRDQ
jgi:hypothetical protein